VVEISFVAKMARCGGEVLTRGTARQSSRSTADPAKADVSSAKAAHAHAAPEAADMSATESTTHMRATTETSDVSAAEAATVSTPTAAARKRISSECPGESHSRGQDDHGLT